MAHLNVLRTVHVPVSAVGRDIKNSFGVVIATATDTFMATAMAALINYGAPQAEKKEEALSERERKIAQLLPKAGV